MNSKEQLILFGPCMQTVRLCPSKLLWASTELVFFGAYIDPVLEQNGSVIRRRSEDQEEEGSPQGAGWTWQPSAGVGMALGRQWWLGGTSPAGQAGKQLEEFGLWDDKRRKRVKLAGEVKQWRFERDCSCLGQGKKINSSSFSSNRTSFLGLRIKYLRLIEFIF